MANGTPQRGKDYRSRYTHQAYNVSYGGIALESGPGPYGSALAGSHQMFFEIEVEVGTDQANVGKQLEFTIAPGLFGHELVVIKQNATAAAAALTITRTGENGTQAQIWTGVLPGETPVPVAMTEVWNFENIDGNRMIRVTIDALSTDPRDSVIVGLLLTPAQSAWK